MIIIHDKHSSLNVAYKMFFASAYARTDSVRHRLHYQSSHPANGHKSVTPETTLAAVSSSLYAIESNIILVAERTWHSVQLDV